MCDKTKMRILPILRTTLLAILTLTFKCSVDLSMIIFNQMPINFTCFLAKNQKLALCITNKSITREDWWTPESYNYQNINLQSKKKPSQEIVWELLSFTTKHTASTIRIYFRRVNRVRERGRLSQPKQIVP